MRITTRTKSFKNTITQRFGGWKVYFKLYKESLQMFDKDLPITKTKEFFIKVRLFLLCLFKPFKQFYHTMSISSGDVAMVFEADTLTLSSYFAQSKCTKITKHYLFGILFLITERELTDEELQEVVKD